MPVSRIDEAGLNVTQYGNRNKILNGAMVLDQRNGGSSVTPTDGQYVLDRWRAGVSTASKFSVQQSSVAPAGFSFSTLCTSLSAYSVGTNDNFEVMQFIEGFNAADLAWGTSDAKTVTLSFWVRSSLTGTFGGTLNNSAFDRSFPFSYTISTANTWEYKTITVEGDTSGTWIGATNGTGIVVSIGLGAGTGRSDTAGSWYGSTLYNATGAVSLVGTNAATLYFTGVQLEAGDTATGFEHRSYGDELAKCMRYYQRLSSGTGAQYQRFGSGLISSATNCFAEVTLTTPMRTVPTLETTGTASNYAVNNGAGAVSTMSAVPTIEPTADNPFHTVIVNCTTSGMTAGNYGALIANNSTSAYLGFDAEL